MSLGATPEEWAHFAQALALADDLLPCVPFSPDVKIYPGSALEGKLGKIPSVFTPDGYAVGLKAWTLRTVLPEELAEWSKDSVYNICIRTGEVYAIDVDINDKPLADAVAEAILAAWPDGVGIEWRTRSNSEKFLVPFRMEDVWPKRIITTQLGRIELLGDGQQFIACGTHPSGVRYQWADGLPDAIPSLTEAQAHKIWDALKQFGASDVDRAASSAAVVSSQDAELRTTISDDDWTQLISALKALQPSAADNDRWSEIGYGLLSLKDARPVRSLWIEFSQGAPNHEAGAPDHWWDTHVHQVPRSDYRHVFGLARAVDWRPTLDPMAFAVPAVASEISGEQGTSDAGVDNGVDLPAPPLPGKPIFRIEGGNLPHLIDKAQLTLAPIIYANGTSLVRVEEDRLVPVSSSWIGDELGRRGNWERFDSRRNNFVACDCPTEFTTKFYALGKWPLIHRIDAIANAPFIRDDGSICDEPGYDERSRTLYQPTDRFPSVPENPTQDAARIALQRLCAPFDQFPLVSDGSRSVFVAHILTEAARLSIDCCPMFWYSAPKSSSGKTLLAEAAARIVHGKMQGKRAWPKDGDEIRKVIYAALLGAERSLIFDNLGTGFKARSPELCAVITSDWWTDRKLGVSEARAVRNRSVLTGTGNNVTPVADLARRSLVVRLAYGGEGRVFKIPDLKGYIHDHRPQLLVDALIILRAYRLHGEGTYPILPSFEQWSERVLAPIMWLGMESPLSTQRTETDDESETQTEAFKVLGPLLNGQLFTAMDVTQLAGVNDALNKALVDSGCEEPHRAKIVGYWLRALRDCEGGSWQLIQAGLHNGRTQWQFIQTDNGDLL